MRVAVLTQFRGGKCKPPLGYVQKNTYLVRLRVNKCNSDIPR